MVRHLLAYIEALFGVGSGVAIAGAIMGRGGRYDYAVGGAALGLAAAIGLAIGVYMSTDDEPAAAATLVVSGLLLPMILSVLFYELSPMPAPRRHASASWTPFLSVTPDGRGASIGAHGVF